MGAKRPNQRPPAVLGVWGWPLEGAGTTLCWWSLICEYWYHLLKRVNTLADAEAVVLGPKGRNMVLEKSFGSPVITKDGVTVAKVTELAEKCENMGVQMIKEVASKTSDMAGDGTATATMLGQAIYRESQQLVAAGVNF